MRQVTAVVCGNSGLVFSGLGPISDFTTCGINSGSGARERT